MIGIPPLVSLQGCVFVWPFLFVSKLPLPLLIRTCVIARGPAHFSSLITPAEPPFPWHIKVISVGCRDEDVDVDGGICQCTTVGSVMGFDHPCHQISKTLFVCSFGMLRDSAVQFRAQPVEYQDK